MEPIRNERPGIAGRMGWPDWLWFALLVGSVCAGAAILFLESIGHAPELARHDFRAVAHWFDPVFFQYSLLLVVLAVLLVPCVTLSYILTMTRRKERRLHREIPTNRRGEIRERLTSRISFSSYLGSVFLTSVVVLLGASILLLFKPVPSAGLGGVDFSLGANVLMMGPFIELFGSDPQAYYIHLTRSLIAFQFGFLGAYIYFVGALARAYFTLDLTPHTLVDGSIRMISASVLALVMSFLPGIHGDVQSATVTVTVAASSGPARPAVGEQAPAQPAWNLGLLPIVSFIFGFFPKWALLALERTTLRTIRNFTPENYRALPLSMLAGMSYAHELRLEREGFDNIENFSTADPVSLAVRTGFGYPQLAQWVSEAWLATHLREHYPEFVRCTGITSRDELHLFLAKWDAARGDAVEQLTKGIASSAMNQIMKVKLTALGTLLDAEASSS